MKRTCNELVDWLGRSNPCPPGGDLVEITLERVGTLRDPVCRLA